MRVVKVNKHIRKRKNGASVVRQYVKKSGSLNPDHFEKRKPKKHRKDSVSMGAKKHLFALQAAAARLRGKANPKPEKVKGKRLPDSPVKPATNPDTKPPVPGKGKKPNPSPTPAPTTTKHKKKINKHRQTGKNSARRLFGLKAR